MLRAVLIVMIVVLATSYGTRTIYLPSSPSLNVVKEIVVTATCYFPEIGQCDSTPLITATGKHIDPLDPIRHRWIAISRDLRKHFRYGDTVWVSGTGVYDGEWVVNDAMAPRHRRTIDFLIGSNNICRTWHNVKIMKNN